MNVLPVQSWMSLSSLTAKAPHLSPIHLQFRDAQGYLTRTIRILLFLFHQQVVF